MSRSIAGAGLGLFLVCGLAMPAAGQLALEEALNLVDLFCNGETVQGSFPYPGSYACQEAVTSPSQSGTLYGDASSSFEDTLFVSANTECVSCPFPASGRASSRISFRIRVARRAEPPQPVSSVPVRITTEGAVGVSNLGFLGGGGTYLSSTLQTIFTSGDVFAHTMQTNPPSGFRPSDDYAFVETVQLFPDWTYFGNVYVGCNQNASATGSWECGAHASASFALDQAAFDASRGEQTFELAQFFALERSPNLVPEPSETLLALFALGAICVVERARRS